MYQSIDQIKTGIKLKMMLSTAGYDVKYIQEYLHLSCPQSIYRWFKRVGRQFYYQYPQVITDYVELYKELYGDEENW